MKPTRIAIQGCGHGELDKIYEEVDRYEKMNKKKPIDLLIICGDVQCLRNTMDLEILAVPEKYKALGEFYDYYALRKKAQVLTIVIGGNHEASNYFLELPYGGWVAPNIYFLGFAGVVWFGGLKICGMSGIYKHNDYIFGHHEAVPLNKDTMRSVYHMRQCDIERALLLSNADICISHDWPRGIEKEGDVEGLLKVKPFFKDEINRNVFGNPATRLVLTKLRPSYWFSAHMHVRYEATIEHVERIEDGNGRKKQDTSKTTKFLALDKGGMFPNGSKRQAFEVLEIFPRDDAAFVEKKLYYDAEWLSILRATDSQYRIWERQQPSISVSESILKYEREWVDKNVKDFEIPLNFKHTAPFQASHAHKWTPDEWQASRKYRDNEQTRALCELIGITVPYDKLKRLQCNPNEIEINDDFSD